VNQSVCSGNRSIIELYTALATNPDQDFGWDKGLENARSHGYQEEWIAAIPANIWNYCAAVGNPFTVGAFKQGDVVLDVGCGAGVDLCVAALLTGDEGKVMGLDLTPAMVEIARANAREAGLTNIEVYEGSIEQLPMADGSINIVISNGAINLATSKAKVFQEVYRVLTVGGQLYFSDMVKDENYLGDSCCSDGSWADCVAGTLETGEIIQLLQAAGFSHPRLVAYNHYKTSDSTIGATFCAHKQ
jgi:SAM-dependent methyltransferase